MAQYPIKMLKDENGTPFVPLVAPEAVKDNQGTDWQALIDKKLEKTNIIAGDNITLSVSGNDITINSQAGGITEVVDSLEGNEIDKAPSVKAVKEKLSEISTTKPKFPFLYYYQQGNLKIIKYAEYGMTYQD